MGFLTYHFRNASTISIKPQASQLSSERTRSARRPGYLSRVLLPKPFTSFSFPTASNACVFATNVSKKLLIFFTLDPGIVGKAVMLCMWAFATSLSFPYRVFRIAFVLSYPSVEKGKPSMNAETLEISSSLRYERYLLCRFLSQTAPESLPVQVGSLEFRYD